MGGYFMPEKKKDESQLSKLTKDSSKVALEQVTAVMTQVMKGIVEKKVFWRKQKIFLVSQERQFDGLLFGRC